MLSCPFYGVTPERRLDELYRVDVDHGVVGGIRQVRIAMDDVKGAGSAKRLYHVRVDVERLRKIASHVADVLETEGS